jgi:ketosteroid isomerase-like protein
MSPKSPTSPKGTPVAASRNAEEIFAHHGQALVAENLAEIVSDYSDDAILMLHKKVYRGKEGARAVFTQLLQDVPQATWTLGTVFADDVLYLEWKAKGTVRHVDDGIDTFLFHNGQIRVQTVQYTLHDN